MTKLLVILGPTASGKTRLAVQVARHMNGEIISADSRQVYRDMTIGTGKDLDAYQVDNKVVPYHLINIIEAGDRYNLYQYQQDFKHAIAQIQSRGCVPVVCGGTGLYLEAVLKGHQFTAVPVDNVLRAKLEAKTYAELLVLFQECPSHYTPLADLSTRKRLIRAIEISYYVHNHTPNGLTVEPITPEAVVFGIDLPVELRRRRITERLHERLRNGLVAEVEQLLIRGIPAEKLIFYGLEYKFITQYVQGIVDYATMTKYLETAIHQFAKRQMTFFRKMERDGLPIRWLDGRLSTEALVETILPLYP